MRSNHAATGCWFSLLWWSCFGSDCKNRSLGAKINFFVFLTQNLLQMSSVAVFVVVATALSHIIIRNGEDGDADGSKNINWEDQVIKGCCERANRQKEGFSLFTTSDQAFKTSTGFTWWSSRWQGNLLKQKQKQNRQILIREQSFSCLKSFSGCQDEVSVTGKQQKKSKTLKLLQAENWMSSIRCHTLFNRYTAIPEWMLSSLSPGEFWGRGSRSPHRQQVTRKKNFSQITACMLCDWLRVSYHSMSRSYICTRGMCAFSLTGNSMSSSSSSIWGNPFWEEARNDWGKPVTGSSHIWRAYVNLLLLFSCLCCAQCYAWWSCACVRQAITGIVSLPSATSPPGLTSLPTFIITIHAYNGLNTRTLGQVSFFWIRIWINWGGKKIIWVSHIFCVFFA